MDRLRYLALNNEINSSPGIKYLSRRKVREFTYNIFSTNRDLLLSACAKLDSPESAIRLMTPDNYKEGTAAHMDVMCHFHNFLAAAKTLVDHTRCFITDHYKNTPIEQAYNQKISSDIANDDLVRFVQDLRNYMLHKALPHSSISINIKKTGKINSNNIKTSVHINREKIIHWEKWTAPSKKYLCNAPAEIKISDIAMNYGKKISDFHNWLDARINKYHAKDLAHLEFLEKQLRLVTSGQT
ncbi:hypothetical protein [Pseudomonas sp. o96-267]|uniref:hypothetical protein n=1 Tax=Pseudomonas sp. o96-267 TaxID=2479853 RepID=UPI000F77022E|nr:hypothetical protein [Pseudomonas sp. o96-267]